MAEEEPRLNAATGISNFIRGDKGAELAEGMIEGGEKRKAIDEAEMRRRQLENVGGYVRLKGGGIYVPEKIPKPKVSMKKLKKVVYRKKPAKKKWSGKLGFIRRTKPIKDRLKVMRLSNMLEKKRLQNQIQKLRLARKMEILKKKGKLQQVVSIPFKRPKLLYPAYATPTEMGDIDSAFYADINHADGNLWGNEAYYDEDFYTEDWWGKEWDTDPFFHLQIKPQQGVSPLLW